MKRAVCFSTGNMYQVTNNIHKMIDDSLKLDVDGIELLFSNAETLLKFRFKKDEISRLRKLKHNTIHLPFYKTERKDRIYFFNTPYCRKIIAKLCKIASQINAVNLNLHAHQLKNEKVLEGFKNFNFTFENLMPYHGFTVKDYKAVLKKHPDFRFLLDTSHAILNNNLKELVKNFKDKISFIHLSAAKYEEQKDHFLIHRFNHHSRKELDIIKRLKCPVIIEAGREKGLKLKDFKKEISYVRRWLK